MHPILGNRLRLWLYLAAWMLVGLALAVLLRATSPRSWRDAVLVAQPMALIYAFVCLSAWWVCRAFPLGRTSPGRLLAALLGAASIAALSWAALAGLWERLVTDTTAHWPGATGGGRAIEPGDRAARAFVLFFAAGVPLHLISAAAHYLIMTFERAGAAERQALQAQVAARESELRALRAQLDPHFLFNSLNSINALVGTDPEGARRMCERLGEFMRLTLALAARETVPLADEMALVERYLAIEQVRFGERLASDVRVEPGAEMAPVPPLLLQPLVENAVKHGVASRLDGGCIRIEAHRESERLVVQIENPCDAEAVPRRGASVGLENVRRRLRATDPGRSQLVAGQIGEIYRVVLTLSDRSDTGEAT
jgi:hypothetical protein